MKFLAAMLFFPMLWLRSVVVVIGRAVSGLFTIVGFAMVFVSGFTRYHCWLIAGLCCLIGFVAFMGIQIYDTILVWLNPTPKKFLFYE